MAASEVGVVDMDDATHRGEGAARARPDAGGRHGPPPHAAQRRPEARDRRAAPVRRVAVARAWSAWRACRHCRTVATRAATARTAMPATAPTATRSNGQNGVTAHGGDGTPTAAADLTPIQLAFGYTAEEVKFIIRPMGAEGKDPVFSMGDDTPLAVLSRVPRLLYAFFKQRFAQVTNPPIDPLREELVMSLRTLIGPRRSMLEETPEHARLLELDEPGPAAASSLRRSRREPSVRWSPGHAGHHVRGRRGRGRPANGRRRAVRGGRRRRSRAGATILMLSDRAVGAGPGADPDADGGRRGPPPPDRDRHPHAGRPGGRERRCLGRPPFRLPDRLRRGGGPSLAGPGDDRGGAAGRAPAGAADRRARREDTAGLEEAWSKTASPRSSSSASSSSTRPSWAC